MGNGRYHFAEFCLDPANRRLSQNGVPIELPARSLDTLVLLVSANGDLVTKGQFMSQVWRDVPVTDEALTQAIRVLRQVLGDSAAAPQFIQTVPKHGYRFIAPVTVPNEPGSQRLVADDPHATFLSNTLAGVFGALLAGGAVGLLYGLLGASQSGSQGSAVSLVLVMMVITIFSSGVAGLGISAGIASAGFVAGGRWTPAGGALGGLIVGAFGNLIGQDAFQLLFGRQIGPLAGALEGFVLGGIAGLAASTRFASDSRLLIGTGLMGMVAGVLLVLLGGKLMAGSIASLVSAFPESALPLDVVGGFAQGRGWGDFAMVTAAGVEGAAFAIAVVWAVRRYGQQIAFAQTAN